MSNFNERHRADAGGGGERGQRAARSGGRTAAQRPARVGAGTPRRGRDAQSRGRDTQTRDREVQTRGRDAQTRGAYQFPTDGSAALRPQTWEPVRRPGVAARARDGAARADAVGVPRLKVAPPRPVSAPRAPFVALVLVVVVGGVLGILLINTKINENAFRLDGLQKQQAALNVQQEQLTKTIAEHEAPGNLAAAARKLGLVESGQPAFIRLPDGQVIGVPRPAQGPPAITSQQGAGG